ncbi:MAG: hypothetical protein Q8O33_05390 [Pseudomonadota bacterium]|nr:hypothetical protein [Pseudomonadota bacterium]
MSRLPLHLLLAFGVVPAAGFCLAAEPPPTPIEATVAASLKTAQSERDRLLAWHQAAESYLAAEARREDTLRAALSGMQRLPPSLMEADGGAWETARSGLNVGELNKLLGEWETALHQAAKTGLVDSTSARALKDSLGKARKALPSFDREAPIKPSANDWNKRRDKLYDVLLNTQTVIGAVLRDSETSVHLLRRQSREVLDRLDGLERLIQVLAPTHHTPHASGRGGTP